MLDTSGRNPKWWQSTWSGDNNYASSEECLSDSIDAALFGAEVNTIQEVFLGTINSLNSRTLISCVQGINVESH